MPRWVPLLLFMGLLGIAFGAPLARFLPAMPAGAIAFWRMATAASMLWIYSAVVVHPDRLPPTKRLSLLWAGVLLAGHFAFFYAAVKRAPIANATLFATLAPVFTLLVEKLFMQRHLSKALLAGLTVSLAGVLIVQGPDLNLDSGSTLGNLLALISSVFMALVLLIAEDVRQETGNIVYTRWLYTIAAITLGFAGAIQGLDFRMGWQDLPWILGLGFLPTILGHNSLSYAVKYLRPTIVGTMPLGEPILATLLALLLFGEPVAGRVAIGGLITLGGLLVVSLGRRPG